MARKRKTLQHLDYNSQEYWNKLLSQEGLSLDAGRPNTHEARTKLVYIGGSNDIETLQHVLVQKATGRTLPKIESEAEDEQ